MHVLIVGAAPCERAECPDLIGSLASEADAVIAVDGGAEHCLQAGVVPRLIVGDLDSVSEETELRLKADGALVARFPAEKDESDLDLAIAQARMLAAETITLTCVTGGRVDHTLAAIGSIARAADLGPRVVEPLVGITLLSAAHEATTLLAGASARVSVLPLLGDATVSISGVRFPLAEHRLQELGSRGLSNVVTSEGAEIVVHDGTVAVIEDDSEQLAS